MDFSQLKQRSENIQQRANEIIENYQKVYDSLNIMYDVLESRIGSSQLRSLSDLIEDYYDIIQQINNTYSDGADGIIRYIERTQANIDQLTSNLKATLNMLNTAVDSIQI